SSRWQRASRSDDTHSRSPISHTGRPAGQDHRAGTCDRYGWAARWSGGRTTALQVLQAWQALLVSRLLRQVSPWHLIRYSVLTFAESGGLRRSVNAPVRHEPVSGQPSEWRHTGSPSMWLIRTALRRPYTFVVMAMLIAIGGAASIRKTPTDIFPTIDIPVLSVIWNFGGLQPEEMEKRVVNNFERFLTTIVSDIDHMESQTLTGIAVIKVYLQPEANVAQAIAQATAVAQTAVRQMPPGAVPPLIMQYSATSVPIMQLAFQSDTLSEQQLFDYGVNFIRQEISTIPGAQIPFPYGGKQRQIMVDIDPHRLHNFGLSPRDVQSALAAQNVVLP